MFKKKKEIETIISETELVPNQIMCLSKQNNQLSLEKKQNQTKQNLDFQQLHIHNTQDIIQNYLTYETETYLQENRQVSQTHSKMIQMLEIEKIFIVF